MEIQGGAGSLVDRRSFRTHRAERGHDLPARDQKILKTEPAKPETAPTRAADEALINALHDRSQKGNAPEFLKPTNRWAAREALLADFSKSRDRTAAEPRGLAESRATPHPRFGRLDAYQWILLISGHCERHTAQINEVKSDPNYPKE